MTATVRSSSTSTARRRLAGAAPAPVPPPRPDWSLLPERVAALAERASAGHAPPVETFAPATGAKIADLPQSDERDLDDAFARAALAQREWAARPVAERAAVFGRLHDLILRRQAEILDIIQTETGKARSHAFEEVVDVAINARYYARTAASTLRDHARSGALPVLTSVREVRHPKGVVVVISPWNYPLALSVSDALPALIAGNAVVSRPDNQTAITTLWAHELAEQAGLPRDVWQVVLGRGRDLGAHLVQRADFVDYTGSTATGRGIAAQAAAQLIGCSLELGGKNAMLVLADADVAKAAAGAVRGCFSSAGQLCESMERLYVNAAVYDDFVAAFVANVAAMRLGANLAYDSDMGSLTFARQLETVQAHVADAVRHGATVLSGGRARPDLGPYFYEPTVLTGVTAQMRVHREETFGPVVSVYRVESDDEAVEQANDTRYGLNASVWTRNTAHGRRVAERIRAGAVNVNDGYAAAWGSIDAPSGGVGDSGLGRRHGREGILKYTDVQTIATQRLFPIAPLPGMSDAMWAKTMTTALWALRRIGRK
ncbi:succinic semialdehyde dehydrogenase [uncultured Jatrophihabitans sp.]|uniref:succinic semialdehyde dehydrogenase n=1 Tax=uncultured Jatrophihabitans sp. TaxID=1610747 RepID=UPI0035C946A1